MRILRSLAALLAIIFFSSVPFSAAQANILITIDRSSQRMSVSVDGQTRWVWPVSTGKRGYVTPSGSYTAFRMEEDHYSKEWDDAPMPHSIFFSKQGHAIHGTFEGKRLGTPASHGCVRLSTQNAAQLFALVGQKGLGNTKVVVTGEQPSAAPVVAKRPQPREEADVGLTTTYPSSTVYPQERGYYPADSVYRSTQPDYGRQYSGQQYAPNPSPYPSPYYQRPYGPYYPPSFRY